VFTEIQCSKCLYDQRCP